MKIRFENFAGVDQYAWQNLAGDPSVRPLYLRLMFAAGGWSNLIGHAEFGPGALAEVLQKVDRSTGEVRRPSENHLRNEIRTAVQMGLLSPGSSEACLIVPSWLDKAAGKPATRTCSHHGIRGKRHRATRPPHTSGVCQ